MIIPTKTIEVVTVEDAIRLTFGNQSEFSDMINVDRGTIRKYLREGNRLLEVTARNEIGEISGLKLINHKVGK